MKPLLKSLSKLGELLRKNQGKIALVLGAIAAAKAIRFFRSRLVSSLRETENRDFAAPKVRPAVAAPSSDRGKRAIYLAPQIPRQALVRH